MSAKALHIWVRGQVQGVWFRASAQNKARELELTGWVRNDADGSVEIHAQGTPANLDHFVLWCRQGPPSAEVSHLDIDSVSMENFLTFEIH